MLNKKIILNILPLFCFSLWADYSIDSNNDGFFDVWVAELTDNSVIISSDTNYDGQIDSKIGLNENKVSLFEETDYNLDGYMDNFYYFENGVIVRQEVDSNYDNKIDVWVYITNNGKAISRYEKDLDYDGVIDKVKEFEVYKEDDQQ